MLIVYAESEKGTGTGEPTWLSCGGTFTGIPSRAFVNFVPRCGAKEKLECFGISRRRVGETGVLGILRGDGAGMGTIVLRADIDALPIQKTNPAEYCSQTPGVMHACGHDAHTACLLAAAARQKTG